MLGTSTYLNTIISLGGRSIFRDPEHYCKITRTLANSRIAQPFSRCSRHNTLIKGKRKLLSVWRKEGRSSSHSGVQVACVTMGNNECGTSRNEISNIMQFSIRLTRLCRSYKIAILPHSTLIRAPEKQLVNYASC